VRIGIVGAGPAGLLFALLIKRRFPEWRIELFEQNPSNATFGFGVVFSHGALTFLERDVPDLHQELIRRMEAWPIQRIVHRDQRVDIDGNGFSAIARIHLNQLLQEHCREAGVRMAYGRAVSSLDELGEVDLCVGADGASSLVRSLFETEFKPRIRWLTNRFIWYGTAQMFDCLTLTFRENQHGQFVAHHYRHSRNMSTFIVECDAATWQRAGLDRLSDAESRAYCERLFAPDLGGYALLSNKSAWRPFPLISNECWWRGNRVLLGDALRTVHFSIGSGTRLAFEDAIALDRAIAEQGDDVTAALRTFECTRRPIVEKLLSAANASSHWYERLPEKMRLEPEVLAYDYMMRSGRMTDDRLREISPKFMAKLDEGRSRP
jgi:2-polyprenyl-6-methoxyphenol hydroxylase-like FAD-dependent oxidoreductase